jgi:hypothetical protein
MSVTRGGKTIFCEGKEGSYDSELIKKVISDLNEKPVIVGAGGKFSLINFIDGYFHPDNFSKYRYVVFRDRDFDKEPTENVQLLQLYSNYMFLTHRACVENYLLDANLIDNYWKEKYKEKEENPSSKWGHEDSPGVEVIAKWIKDSAYSLKDYQAVRWALGSLLQMKEGREKLKTTWTSGSGKLPQSLSLQDCRSKAAELIKDFRGNIEQITEDRFNRALDKYNNMFSSKPFWDQEKYLIWFHGKDIQKAMQKENHRYISLDHFFSLSMNYFDFRNHKDLVELHEKIKTL